MGCYLIVHCWAVIIGVGALFIVWPNPLTLMLAICIIAGRQLGLSILMHEAAHNTLFKTAWLNRTLAQYICAYPVGTDVHSYRDYHLTHHKYTQQDGDPDLGLSAPFPTTRASMRRKFIRDLTGQTALRQRGYQFLQMFWRKQETSANAFKVPGLRGPLVINVIIFAVLAISGYWWAYFVLWLLPLFTVFQLVLRVRNIAEHAVTERSDNQLRHARTTRANWLARMFVAPYWVNYHVEHHAFMFVPCWQLPRLDQALVDAGHLPEMEVQPNYRAVLNLAAPHA